MHSTLECSISLWDRASPPQRELLLNINAMPDLWCSSSAEGRVCLHLQIEASVLMTCCDHSVIDRRFSKGAWGPLPLYLQNLFAPLPKLFWLDFSSMWIITVPLTLMPAATYSILQELKSYLSALTSGWNGWAWVKILKKDWTATHTHSPSEEAQQTPWGSLCTRPAAAGDYILEATPSSMTMAMDQVVFWSR